MRYFAGAYRIDWVRYPAKVVVPGVISAIFVMVLSASQSCAGLVGDSRRHPRIWESACLPDDLLGVWSRRFGGRDIYHNRCFGVNGGHSKGLEKPSIGRRLAKADRRCLVLGQSPSPPADRGIRPMPPQSRIVLTVGPTSLCHSYPTALIFPKFVVCFPPLGRFVPVLPFMC